MCWSPQIGQEAAVLNLGKQARATVMDKGHQERVSYSNSYLQEQNRCQQRVSLFLGMKRDFYFKLIRFYSDTSQKLLYGKIYLCSTAD